MSTKTTLAHLSGALARHHLDALCGSAFDNAFAVFDNPPEVNNLVVLGTNGNLSDSSTTEAALRAQAERPNWSSVLDGVWGDQWRKGESPLQKQLRELPDLLTKACPGEIFRLESTVFTNALLLATKGVSGIPAAVRAASAGPGRSRSTTELFDDSLRFFVDGTLALARPRLIFCYGNAVSGHSAWHHLTRFAGVVGEKHTEPRPGRRHPARFANISLAGAQIPVIGWPHLSYAFNAVDPEVVERGLRQLSRG